MSTFAVTRSRTVRAPRERVRALIEDLRAWQGWSPWQDADPDMTQTCSGPERGVGRDFEKGLGRLTAAAERG